MGVVDGLIAGGAWPVVVALVGVAGGLAAIGAAGLAYVEHRRRVEELNRERERAEKKAAERMRADIERNRASKPRVETFTVGQMKDEVRRREPGMPYDVHPGSPASVARPTRWLLLRGSIVIAMALLVAVTELVLWLFDSPFAVPGVVAVVVLLGTALLASWIRCRR